MIMTTFVFSGNILALFSALEHFCRPSMIVDKYTLKLKEHGHDTYSILADMGDADDDMIDITQYKIMSYVRGYISASDASTVTYMVPKLNIIAR